MRISKSKSANTTNYYIIDDVYKDDGTRSTVRIKSLGNSEFLTKKYGTDDFLPIIKDLAKKMTVDAKKGKTSINLILSNFREISRDDDRLFYAGFLFLMNIFYSLDFDKMCKEISDKFSFKFSLSEILQALIFSRILHPSSKLSTYEFSRKFITRPSFSVDDLYRSLDVLADSSDFIQSFLYKSSKNLFTRSNRVLYYDCSNFFFEIENEVGFKRYGKSKEHRPNPIVQMGLFIDGDGIPLAFSLFDGSSNEQTSLKPLEQRIISDFSLSKFVVCTDAGLSSTANRRFNGFANRFFVTTQSLKKLKSYIRDWALDTKGFRLMGSDKLYDLSKLNPDDFVDDIFYKSRWINDDVEQNLIVTFSFKYQLYQRSIRNEQISRLERKLEKGTSKVDRVNPNDIKRFLKRVFVTKDGECANKKMYSIDYEAISKEEMYDGFYATCTNLDDDPIEVLKIIKGRWQIEDCFRIMKTEFRSRPVYLQKENRIKAHFLTCFLALVFYKILEKLLDKEYTCHDIIETLKNYNFLKLKNYGYIPTYKPNDIIDKLHDTFKIKTDVEIVDKKSMEKIIKKLKKENITKKD